MKSTILAVIAFLMFVPFGSSIFAQGFIIPRPVPPYHPPLPQLTEHKVDVEIIDQVAQVEIHQVFYNDSKRTIEGNYYFPLPKGASVSDFKMYVDGKVLSGELLEKEKARRIYEDIVRRNIDPALLEYVDHNLFSAKIFPIPPKKERKIVLEYSMLLKLDGDLVQFTYPLRGQFESERMVRRPRPIMPGPPYVIPLEEEDEDKKARRKEDKKPYADISQVIFVDLNSKIPLKNIYSPSHEVDISREDDHHAKISFEDKRKETEDNFVLYYSFSQSDFGLNILTYHPEDNEKNFFMLLISPKTEISKKEILEKEIVFIMDVSGSMSGEKIDQAKDALKYCINHLDRNDRFNLITFSTESKLFNKELVATSEYRKDAIAFIDKIEAKGGTNINEALLDALDMGYEKNRPISIVFITDGLPTVGETDIGKIISNVSDKNKDKIKVFTFGVGYDVNTVLLDKIATSNRAVSDYIEPNENIEQKISSFYDKISHPVLTDLSLDFGRIEVEDVFPQKLPDLFKGSQLTVFGRYEKGTKQDIKLTGKIKDKDKKFTYEADFSSFKKEHDFIPYLWATRKIGYLMDEIRLHSENKELKDEIIRLSKKYGVMSPYTSFLVQEEGDLAYEMSTQPVRILHQRTDALYLDHDNGITAGIEKKSTAPAPMDKGRFAVRMSKMSREMKEKETEGLRDTQYVKRIGARTFYFKNDFWVDGEYKDEKTIDIKYSSQAYTDLVLTYPEVAKFVAIGEKLIFKFKNKFIKISDKGREKFPQDELKKLFK
jgi:Ca-activated chloride channel family protein